MVSNTHSPPAVTLKTKWFRNDPKRRSSRNNRSWKPCDKPFMGSTSQRCIMGRVIDSEVGMALCWWNMAVSLFHSPRQRRDTLSDVTSSVEDRTNLSDVQHVAPDQLWLTFLSPFGERERNKMNRQPQVSVHRLSFPFIFTIMSVVWIGGKVRGFNC